MINELTILILRCSVGVYLRWYYNGWHYFNFTNGYEISLRTGHEDKQVSNYFSRVSQSEHPTKISAEYSYQIVLEGISEGNIPGFIGLLLAEKVEQYESGVWREVELIRGEHSIKDGFYSIEFEITRKELPGTPAEYLTSQFLYLGDTLCDIGEDELIPLNRQANDIAEMQDRQADFTTQFKIRKTRAMKLLFELSGEVGAVTTFPYENQTCKLIQNGIEIISQGQLILDKSDDNYYYVSILSGNANFFKTIESLKIGDLTLAGTSHYWTANIQQSSQENDFDYLYPLIEPSNDGASAISDDGDAIEMYSSYLWPFCKVKAIWDEIFVNAGFTPEGDILTNEILLRLFMPITNLKTTKGFTDSYLYSAHNYATQSGSIPMRLQGLTSVIGDVYFNDGRYRTVFSATYKFRVIIQNTTSNDGVKLYLNGIEVADFVYNAQLSYQTGTYVYYNYYDCEYTTLSGKEFTFYSVDGFIHGSWISVIEITNPAIGYGSSIASLNIHLPELSQTEFIKMICNMFGLIPETDVWNKKVKFWNYLELYDNIPFARDWSRYLSESQGETEFKFGEYAQNNYLNYKESDDVLKNEGRGNFQVDDQTLPFEKDVVQLPVSTCDEVQVLTDVDISRIAFNTYNPDTGLYDANQTIDPRIVYVKTTDPAASPAKTFRLNYSGGFIRTITTPRIASSLEIAMSSMIDNYSGLSRLLTETNYCRLKFNLPVYEVANLKHYIPVYIEQYKAYFYVNKINNYIPGKLCTVEMIKL